jgi:hypothetical protein
MPISERLLSRIEWKVLESDMKIETGDLDNKRFCPEGMPSAKSNFKN